MESLIIKTTTLKERKERRRRRKKVLKISENKRAIWGSAPQANIS